MKAKITKTSVNALKPQEKAFEVVDTDIKGFLLRVQPTGRMTFYFSYRPDGGNRKRIKIGLYGSDLTVAQARDKAMILAGQVRRGRRPAREAGAESRGQGYSGKQSGSLH